MKGMIMTMAAGGALSERRESRLMKEARRVAGRCLKNLSGPGLARGKSVDLRRAEEEFRHTEEPCAVLEVQDISVKESVEAGVEGGVVEVVVPHQRKKAIQREKAQRSSCTVVNRLPSRNKTVTDHDPHTPQSNPWRESLG